MENSWTSNQENEWQIVMVPLDFVNIDSLEEKRPLMSLVSLESEATPSATPFFKRAYKISYPPQLSVSWIDLPSFASLLKIWPYFSNKGFFCFCYEKVILTRNVRLTYYSSMKKKFRKIRMIFDIENSL